MEKILRTYLELSDFLYEGRRDLNLLKSTFKALHADDGCCDDNLELHIQTH